jgi:PPOX class probable F420-dependent enzyme
MLNLTPTRQAVIEQWLTEDLIIWLTTVDPSGRPHSVPVWFWWDGEQITIFSQPETRKVRHLRANPAVALALQTRDEGEEVIAFEGNAAFAPEPTSAQMTDGYKAKYAHLFPRIGSTPDKMAEDYSLVIRVTPTKVMAWGIAE